MTSAAEPTSALMIIERLLRRIERLALPDHWAQLTPQELHMDSLDLVELQLELESACGVTLSDDDVTAAPLTHLTLGDLAQRVETLRSGPPRG